MLKRTLAYLLSAISFLFVHSVHASNIKVTTIKDEVKVDDDCSLREAVDFVTNKFANKDSECNPKDNNPSQVIELNTKDIYELQSPIYIKSSMNIVSDLVSDISNLDGKKITTIKASNSRAFVIDDESGFKNNIAVTIKGIEIHGMGYEKKMDASLQSKKLYEGGIIYNRESLNLERVRLLGGMAEKGGAVFNASIDSKLKITESEIISNKANKGSGIYSEHESVVIGNSLFQSNETFNPDVVNDDAFVVETLTAYPQTLINSNNAKKSFVVPRQGKVSNTIFYNNKGSATLNILPGVEANNLTIINNSAGVYLNSKFNYRFKQDSKISKVIASYLANSVLLGNDKFDIKIANGDLTFMNHLLVGENNIQGSKISTYQFMIKTLSSIQTNNLIASKKIKNEEGKENLICLPPSLNETTGLFCPILKQSEEFVANLKPRLLMTYNSVDDSPVVNKGSSRTNNTNADVLECEAKDMRKQVRKICDLGAFELNINKSGLNKDKSVNAEIEQGQVAKLSLKDISGDGQLIPASECNKYVQNPPSDASLWLSGTYNKWTDGCLMFVAGSTPSKGKLTLSASKNELLYEATEAFHGVDNFKYQLITTTSRFSQAYNDQLILAKTTIYQYPKQTFKDGKVDVGYSQGSGSFGWQFMLGLFGLMGLSYLVNQKRK